MCGGREKQITLVYQDTRECPTKLWIEKLPKISGVLTEGVGGGARDHALLCSTCVKVQMDEAVVFLTSSTFPPLAPEPT